MLLRQHGGLSGLGLTLDTRLCHASETDVTPVLGRRNTREENSPRGRSCRESNPRPSSPFFRFKSVSKIKIFVQLPLV